MFSGLLVCADCGKNLHFHINNRNIKYFNCPGYNKGKLKDCFASRYVRMDFLEQVVLTEIRRLTRFACKYEEEFVKTVSEFSKNNLQIQIKAYESEVKTLISRDRELDRIFEKLYEDNISGKISDERFGKMSANYENEQNEIHKRMKKLNNMLDELSGRSITANKFIDAVRKYTRVKKLTPKMVAEMIEHIEVYHTEKVEGIRTQKLVIYYNCIGSIQIPEDIPIEEADVSMKTRQGVNLLYVPTSPSTVA